MALERSVLPLAGVAALLAGLAAYAERHTPPARPPSARATGRSAEPANAPCPPGSLPDQGVCVPVPRNATEAREPSGGAPGPDIPLRPGQPPALTEYTLPLRQPELETGVRNADRSPSLPGLPPLTGLWIAARAGSEVTVPHLAGQQGDARVLWVTDLVGPTVATEHRVVEAGRERLYLVVAGNLQALPPLAPGKVAPEVLGRVGDGLTPSTPSLYLDVRRPREGVDVRTIPPESLLQASQTLSVDPRNVLGPRRR